MAFATMLGTHFIFSTDFWTKISPTLTTELFALFVEDYFGLIIALIKIVGIFYNRVRPLQKTKNVSGVQWVVDGEGED